ncbi:MAG: hypothetical protein GOVbin5978_9 [Prokaryotic dsDNA virus sp.]|nr:MAG: hypothetical protein GOVbin5978_9 [Prokaryotic dsDNA virus sp.]|tara:strand:- start:22179 stop:22556 length:378 start_codon:yes stop_codon:yes gene_type:complete
METNFTTKLEGLDVDVFGLETYVDRKQNHDVEAVAVIDWYLYQEFREWGVNSIGCYATKVAIELTINWWNDDDSVEQKTLTIETEHTSNDDWQITEYTSEVSFGYVIQPQSLELNFDTKEITINY